MRRPRIFISSTISDFSDLRGALRYWLDQAGFDVQLSEYTDFDRPPTDDVFQACFRNIRSSDRYILLIGRRRGSWYDEAEQLTVTRQEFRVAGEASRMRGTTITAFVRRDVEVALRQWATDGRPSHISDADFDPTFTSEFLDEVRTEGGHRNPPRWVSSFSDFRDIIDGIRSTFGLDLNIPERLLRENLASELAYNLAQMTMQAAGRLGVTHTLFPSGRDAINMTKDDFRRQVMITEDQAKPLGLIPFFQPRSPLRTQAMRTALAAGLFLEVRPAAGATEIRTTEAQTALESLVSDVELLEGRREDELQKQANAVFVDLTRKANTRGLAEGASVPGHYLFAILHLFDRIDDVYKGMVGYLAWLEGSRSNPTIERNPLFPVAELAARSLAERPSPAEVRKAVRESMYPFGNRLRTEDRKALAEAQEGYVERLRALIPEDIMDEKQLRSMVEEVLDGLVAEEDGSATNND